MKKYIQLAVVLLVISGLSGLVLSLTYQFAKPAIDQVALNKINDSMHEWFPVVPLDNKKENATPDYTITDPNINNVYDAKDANGNIVGYVIEAKAPESYGGGMVLLVGIDNNGKVVGYTYLTFNESGPGANVRNNTTFHDSLIGQTQVEDQNGNFTVAWVTGASFTSKATLRGIHNALTWYHDNVTEVTSND